jgi:hypothetical protein
MNKAKEQIFEYQEIAYRSAGNFYISYFDGKSGKYKKIFSDKKGKYYFFIKKDIRQYLTEEQTNDLIQKAIKMAI